MLCAELTHVHVHVFIYLTGLRRHTERSAMRVSAAHMHKGLAQRYICH